MSFTCCFIINYSVHIFEDTVILSAVMAEFVVRVELVVGVIVALEVVEHQV